MRRVGRLHDWNDARGFGFVTPDGGGERAFVHVRAFERRERRPVDGDVLDYAVEVDGRGRRNAVSVRFVDARRGTGSRSASRSAATSPRRARRFSATGVAAVFAVALAVACALRVLPWPVAGVYTGASALLYVVYRADKAAAQRGRRRTPESTLHALALLGGWPGAAFAQQHFEHKRSKAAFVSIYVATIVLNVAGLVAFAIARRQGAI